MNDNAKDRIMVRAILSLINDDEGIVVEDIDSTKYIVTKSIEHKKSIKIERITGNDDCVVQTLSDGQIVYLDK